MEEAVESEDLEFKWGKKKSIGGKKKDVQFYESFTYDGDEYRLYDCVLVGDASEPDSTEPFVGMIIKIWEHADKHIPRKVKLLWFFKPSEIAPYLEGVPDVLANELFLASGEGRGLTNINQLEAIGGKCSVFCISKDKRNPQPSDEKIKSTDFVFRRAFDVGSCKVVDKLDDKIAGVDVKFIFNRAGCEKEATAVQKTEADINGNSDSLKPNGPLASGSDRKIGDTSIESSDCKESSYGCKQEKEKGHYQLATKKSTLAEERFNKDSGSGGNHCDGVAQESEVKKQFIKQKSRPAEGRYSSSCEASGSREIHSNSKKAQVNDVKKQLTKQKFMPAEGRYNKESNGLDDRPLKKQKLDGSATVPDGRNTTSLQNITSDGVAQESEVKKQFIKQKSMPAEGRYSSSCEASGSREIHSNSKKAQVNDVKKQLTKQKSMPAEGRYNKESNGLDDRPLKKQKLDGSATVPDGRNTTSLQNITSDGKQDTGTFKRPRDKMKREEVPPEKPSFVKKRDLGVLVSEGKDTKTATEKCLSKKPRFERAEDKILADYQVIEVSRRPDAEKINWFRSLPWKESMRDAEKKGTVVLLQNLDPTYTSDEVEDIVYSALNEQCEARMIERTSVTVPHIGEALVIFKTREVAERVIRRLDEGCLLLSNGRPLVAVFAKITPPGKPSSFSGHIKLHKTQTRREMRDAVATSHGAQPNNLEFDMAMEWCLHQARHKQSSERISKRQLEEIRSLRINFKPKLR